MGFQIAIDGPSGSGKSSLAKAIAKKYKFYYIDTGAMYRTVGLNAVNKGIDLDNVQGVIATLESIDINVILSEGSQKIQLDNVDVTDLLRTEEVGSYASKVASIPEVRTKLVELQQRLASTNNVVIDGRDIGTVVLKNADIKLFVDASIEARTNRRIGELKNKNIDCDYNKIYSDIEERDYRDRNRSATPLVQASDAIYIDTSNLTFDKVIEKVSNLINEKI